MFSALLRKLQPSPSLHPSAYRTGVFLKLLKARLDEHIERDHDPTIEETLEAATGWLCRAQDHSMSQDGGVARHYSLQEGWSTSYPETTGYIIPTMLDRATDLNDPSLAERARRMLDWLVSIQEPDGGIQAGVISAHRAVPVTFNTGQVLLGLARGTAEFGDVYGPAMHAAAHWLVTTQDADGAWRRHATPFAEAGEKAYETHVAWGLLEAARLDPDRPYSEAAFRNIRWALTKQLDNGWFADCCLNDSQRPLTHTIGYVLRGLVEGFRFFGDQRILDAARLTAQGLLHALHPDGSLAGRLDAQWNDAAGWVCLTGNVQIAHCWLLLYQMTGESRFRDAAFAANRYVRSTIILQGPPEIRGGVSGSAPIWGEYGRLQYLNWACKFLIDSHRLERAIRESEGLPEPLYRSMERLIFTA